MTNAIYYFSDAISPWNSDNDLDSLGSLPDAKSPARNRSRTDSLVSSRTSRSRTKAKEFSGLSAQLHDLGPAENVVATLRLLVALEDYLGSLGPKIVDLLTEALKMEKVNFLADGLRLSKLSVKYRSIDI